MPVAVMLIIVMAELWLGKQYPLPVHAAYMIICIALLGWVYRNEIRLIDLKNLIK
jgi:archaellum biogenesis protein FlaJ (TadC family)